MATRQNDAFARRGLPNRPRRQEGFCAQASGVRRARIPRGGRLHGPRQLGDRSRRWCAVRIHAPQRDPDVQPDGDTAPGVVIQARDRHRTRPRAGVPRQLLETRQLHAVGRVRDRDRGLRSGRSDRHRHRPQSAVRHSGHLRRRHHRGRRAGDSVSPEQGIQAAGGARHHPDRDRRGLLPVRDHSGEAAIRRRSCAGSFRRRRS